MNHIFKVVGCTILHFILANTSLLANTKKAPAYPLTHCYHWLNQQAAGYLTFKYQYAKENNNELTFYTRRGTSNGAMAGPGLYCAKSPAGSYGYGDRVIRINLVSDVVLKDNVKTDRKYCGHEGERSKECEKKPVDILYFSSHGNGADWYVIQNPQAVDSWTANDQMLIDDLKANMQLEDSSFKSHAEKTLTYIQEEIDQGIQHVFYNLNARMPIIDMIHHDIKKLNDLPATNVISRVSVLPEERLSDSKKQEVYATQVDRILKDKHLTLGDINPILRENKLVNEIYLQRVKVVLENDDYENYNISFLLDFALANKLEEHVLKSWVILLNDPRLMSSFIAQDFGSDPFIISTLDKAFIAIDLQNISDEKLIPSYHDLVAKFFPKERANQIKSQLLKNFRQKIEPKLKQSQNKNWNILLEDKTNLPLYITKKAQFIEQCALYFTYYFDTLKNAYLGYQDAYVGLHTPNDRNEIRSACQLNSLRFERLKELKKDDRKLKGALDFEVEGFANDIPFLFYGNNLDQILKQAYRFHKRLTNRQDDIVKVRWRVNSDGAYSLSQPGHELDWPSEFKKHMRFLLRGLIPSEDSLIAQNNIQEIIDTHVPDKGQLYVVEGQIGGINNYPFRFAGYHLNQIMKQAKDFHRDIIDDFSDRISFTDYSINGKAYNQPYSIFNFRDSWQDMEMHLQLALYGKVMTETQIDIFEENNRVEKEAKDKNLKVYDLHAIIGRHNQATDYFKWFNIKATYREELYNKAIRWMKDFDDFVSIDRQRARYIYYSLDDDSRTTQSPYPHSWIGNIKEFRRVFNGVLDEIAIPSKHELK